VGGIAHDGATELTPSGDDPEGAADLGRVLRQLVRRARETSGRSLTCRELARQTGYGHSTINNWLEGRSLPSADRLDDLLAALGATPREQRMLATVRDQVEERRRSPSALATVPDEQGVLDAARDEIGEPAPLPGTVPQGRSRFPAQRALLRALAVASLLAAASAAAFVLLASHASGQDPRSMAPATAGRQPAIRGTGQDPPAPGKPWKGKIAFSLLYLTDNRPLSDQGPRPDLVLGISDSPDARYSTLWAESWAGRSAREVVWTGTGNPGFSDCLALTSADAGVRLKLRAGMAPLRICVATNSGQVALLSDVRPSEIVNGHVRQVTGRIEIWTKKG
jgi:transcriptional regulator with XRE-family HTH domain